MLARALLALACAGVFAPAARAVTIDDFASPYPGTGTLFTGPLGSFDLVEPGIASVLGGTRHTRLVATNPSAPTGVSIINNPSPPPIKNVLEAVVGGGGGSVRLGYPGLTSYDVTLGGTSAFPSTVEVLAALMVAGGTVELTLSDSGGSSATASLPTADFAGGSPSGLTKYAFFPTASSFPGVNLLDIDELAVRVALPTGADFELSEIGVVPVAGASADWSRAFAFEPAGAGTPEPRVLVGFDRVPPDPVSPPVLDLSDPVRPRITWVGGIEPQPFFEILVGAYGGLGIDPCIAPGAELELELKGQGGAIWRLQLEISSGGGMVLDPATLFGFNPQPEPPGAGQFEWSEIPDEDQPQSFGLTLGLQSPMMAAPTGVGGESVTLSFQILGPGGSPIPLQQVQPVGGPPIPALPFWAALALVGLLAALLAVRRPARV